MSHIRIVIDGDTLFDDDLDVWQATPPDQFKELLTPGAKPKPWMKAIMIVMADAAMTDNNVSIEAATAPEKWAIEVVNL